MELHACPECHVSKPKLREFSCSSKCSIWSERQYFQPANPQLPRICANIVVLNKGRYATLADQFRPKTFLPFSLIDLLAKGSPVSISLLLILHKACLCPTSLEKSVPMLGWHCYSPNPKDIKLNCFILVIGQLFSPGTKHMSLYVVPWCS